MKLTIRKADWITDKNRLRDIRREVFIEEQNVPEDLEWDGLDDTAQHWIAEHDDKVIGTLRLLPDGHIGRVAVLPSYRGQSVGKQLMNACIEDCDRQQLLSCYLYSQTHAHDFYEKLGFDAVGEEFMDAGIAHIKMVYHFNTPRLLGHHGGKFAIRNLADTVSDVVSQTERQLSILSYDLSPEIYNQRDLISAISALARKSRYTEIRLLVADTKALVKRDHGLLELSRRLSSKIEIRRTEADLRNIPEAYVVADSRGVIVYPLKTEDETTAWANYNNKPMAEARLAEFDLLWARAVQDRELKLLGIS